MIRDEHKFLFSSKESKNTGIIPKANILIRIYLFSFIAVIIILLSAPILNVLRADNMIDHIPKKEMNTADHLIYSPPVFINTRFKDHQF